MSAPGEGTDLNRIPSETAGAGPSSGMVALLGRPNVGKSTLLNGLMGRKLSIVSRKPQTTRHRILGIKTAARFQVVYVDTPGLHRRSRRALNRYMNRAASEAVEGVDVVVLVVEAMRWTDEDDLALSRARRCAGPLLGVVNKVDLVPRKDALLPYLQQVEGKADFRHLLPMSARRAADVRRLEGLILPLLPAGEPLFPAEQFSDRGPGFLAAELLREKLTHRLGQELPYRISVEIESYAERRRRCEIDALIWVERPSHKGIVIGKHGELLKRAGSEARRELEGILGKPVGLRTWVKVKEGWSDDARSLRELGYAD